MALLAHYLALTALDDNADDLIRFNESIDHMQAEALVRYKDGLNR